MHATVSNENAEVKAKTKNIVHKETGELFFKCEIQRLQLSEKTLIVNENSSQV